MPQLNILPLVCKPMLVSRACWSGGQGVVHIHYLVGYKLESVNMINVVIHADTEFLHASQTVTKVHGRVQSGEGSEQAGGWGGGAEAGPW